MFSVFLIVLTIGISSVAAPISLALALLSSSRLAINHFIEVAILEDTHVAFVTQFNAIQPAHFIWIIEPVNPAIGHTNPICVPVFSNIANVSAIRV
jgi:hypothetical protein